MSEMSNTKPKSNAEELNDAELPMLDMHDAGGFVYDGDRSESCNLKDGFGCFTDGKICYHGQWSNGLPNGLGCFATLSYVFYGQIRRGRIEGFGQMACKENSGKSGSGSRVVSFAGHFSNGSPDGPGIAVFYNGGEENIGSGASVDDCGLPRREGFFRGSRMLRQSLQPQAVSTAVRCAKRARAIVANGGGCGCDKNCRLPPMVFVSMPV